MGVGKTVTSKELQKVLSNCVFLDGDWCWDASPFHVTEETKRMVIDNIVYLLQNFLKCSAYDNIIFCWVMHEESIMKEILSKIDYTNSNLYKISLVCGEETLRKRIGQDIKNGDRSQDVLERSIQRLNNYHNMDTISINVDTMTAKQTAMWIQNEFTII